MKHLVYIVILLIASCSRFDSKKHIFIENKNCLDSKLECSFAYKNQDIFELKFSADPKKRDQNYSITLLADAKIESATAELIGMNMEMPANHIEFSKAGEFYKAEVIPGICTENKMLWRLKINLVLSNNTRYYTFINYQVGR